MVTQKRIHAANLKWRIIRDLSSDPNQTTTVVITETMVGGGSVDLLIEAANDIVRRFPNIKVKMIVLQQTAHTQDAAGIVAVRHKAIVDAERVLLKVQPTRYILGEDVAYQSNQNSEHARSPVILFKATGETMYAYQIIPREQTTARDIVIDVVNRKYNGRLPNVL